MNQTHPEIVEILGRMQNNQQVSNEEYDRVKQFSVEKIKERNNLQQKAKVLSKQLKYTIESLNNINHIAQTLVVEE